jgi:hypothetical protein
VWDDIGVYPKNGGIKEKPAINSLRGYGSGKNIFQNL